MGSKFGHDRFSLIDRYDGSMYMPGYGEKCKETLLNSSEGVCYAQYLEKETVLRYWRKTMCKVFSLHYVGEHERYGIKAYEYGLPPTAFDRTGEDDCHAGDPTLPNGLQDASKCYFGKFVRKYYLQFYFLDRCRIPSGGKFSAFPTRRRSN